MLKGEHSSTLVKKENPLVSQDKCDSNNSNPSKSMDDKQDICESDKDKLIRNLKSDLRQKGDGMKALEALYVGCEKEIKRLQEDNERLKIRVKDLGEYVQLSENEDIEEIPNNDSEDDDTETWKTVPSRHKAKPSRKDTTEAITCSICNQYVLTTNELKAHILRCHIQDTQDNCNECDFQATSKAEIIKHKNVKHRTRQNQEVGSFQCDKCNQQFSANWNLKNHIRDHHEEARGECIYYQQGRCNFSESECWNSHRAKEVEVRPNKEDFKCFSCHMMFKTKSGMFKHRKIKHIDEVPECRKYQVGECGFSNNYCWNKHTNKEHETSAPSVNQDFQKGPGNLDPPENSS